MGNITPAAAQNKAAATSEKDTLVLISTPMGDIKVKLYKETPKHRANFLKLVQEGFYNGTLFHRVIKDFMIQGGDPDSKKAAKGAQLGNGDTGYTVPAEFCYPQYFHKRGSLAAAREGDQVNPLQASSGCQFYLVWGKTFVDGELDQYEQRIASQQAQVIFNRLQERDRDKIDKLFAADDRAAIMNLQDSLKRETMALYGQHPFKFTPEVREAYKNVGGTPFLDSQYTVFGEIVSGLDVVDKIQKVSTDGNDRPQEDIPMTMKIVVE